MDKLLDINDVIFFNESIKKLIKMQKRYEKDAKISFFYGENFDKVTQLACIDMEPTYLKKFPNLKFLFYDGSVDVDIIFLPEKLETLIIRHCYILDSHLRNLPNVKNIILYCEYYYEENFIRSVGKKILFDNLPCGLENIIFYEKNKYFTDTELDTIREKIKHALAETKIPFNCKIHLFLEKTQQICEINL